MAEMLLRAKPDAPAVGGFQRGSPIVVMPDGHRWGKRETLPDFIVLRFPGVDVASLAKYIEPEEGVRRRRWRVRVEDMPAGARTKAQQMGYLTIPGDAPWTVARTYFLNQVTGLAETEDL